MSNNFPDLLQWSTGNLLLFGSKLSHNSQIVKIMHVKAQNTSLYLFLETGFFEIIKEVVVHSP